jgi:hypothetical protein
MVYKDPNALAQHKATQALNAKNVAEANAKFAAQQKALAAKKAAINKPKG